jgi:hypothetical protein
MTRRLSLAVVIFACLVIVAQTKPGVLSADEVRRVTPATYFFRGQSATVQMRNAAGFSAAGEKLVLAGLVDTSGYASDVQAKYQGLLITEINLDIEGTKLSPGQYGFGFSQNGKFLVMDVGANDLFSVASKMDEKLAHPVPLKIVEDGGAYRLYAGRKFVSLKPE